MGGFGSRADPSVVELSEQEVKRNLFESLENPGIGNDALRSTGQEHVGVALDIFAEDIIVLVEVFRRRHFVVGSFEIKIETINGRISERTRLVGSFPFRGNGSKCSDQELGEPVGDIGRGQVVIDWPATTE